MPTKPNAGSIEPLGWIKPVQKGSIEPSWGCRRYQGAVSFKTPLRGDVAGWSLSPFGRLLMGLV